LAAFEPKVRGKALESNPDIPDYTGYEIPKGRLQAMWDSVEAERRKAEPEKKPPAQTRERPLNFRRVGSLQQLRDEIIPHLVREYDGEVLSPRDAAETVKENVRVIQVTPENQHLINCFALVNYEAGCQHAEDVGLPTERFSLEDSAPNFSNPDDRAFILRYDGPELAVRGRAGIAVLKGCNVLGVHTQKNVRIFGDSFFENVLMFRRQGKPSEWLYAGAIMGHRDNLERNITTRGMRSFQEVLDDGLFDRFIFSDMATLNETEEGITSTPNAVFLRHVNILVGGMGLTEPLLKQALAHDRDAERAKYAFAYARMDQLYKERVPQELWPVFEKFMVLKYRDGGASLGQDKLLDMARLIADTEPIFLHNQADRKREDGKSYYRTLRFHEDAGGELICAIPWCAMDDSPSLFAGVLVVYDLGKLRREGRI
jgi:hypothetical protein